MRTKALLRYTYCIPLQLRSGFDLLIIDSAVCYDKEGSLLSNYSEKKSIRSPRQRIKDATMMVVTVGILTAMCIVISLFLTIHTESIKITLTFIPILIASRLYGPIGGGLVAGLADILQAVFQPVGAWFPPITLTAVAVGVFFGFVFQKKYSIARVIIAAAVSELVLSLFVTPIWLNMLYGTPYTTLLLVRIPQICIMTAIKIIVTPAVFKLLDNVPYYKDICSR